MHELLVAAGIREKVLKLIEDKKLCTSLPSESKKNLDKKDTFLSLIDITRFYILIDITRSMDKRDGSCR